MTTVSFAGSGRITAAHGLAVRALPGVTVTAVASRDPAHATERARQMEARTCSYDELPAGADVVIVATPPARHAQDVLHALDRGASVIVEKPLCTTLAQADALVAAAGPGGERIGYAENLAFAPIVAGALDLAAGLGSLRHLEVRALSSRPDWGDFLRARWGGGVLFDLGVHPLALAMLLADAAARGSGDPAGPGPKVVSVRARLDGADDIEVDDDAEVDLTFDTGLVAHVEASWRAARPQWDLQAASDAGVVRAELLPGILLEHNGEPVDLPPVPAAIDVPQIEQFGYRAQIEGFLADFAARRAPALDVAFGRDVLDVVCAAYSSAGHGGAVVPVPFVGPRDRTPLELWRHPS
ncbi:MAG TPA: Gfo/Idh/MocA family oxidoreductase [Acidimicrobiales bacterium]